MEGVTPSNARKRHSMPMRTDKCLSPVLSPAPAERERGWTQRLKVKCVCRRQTLGHGWRLVPSLEQAAGPCVCPATAP